MRELTLREYEKSQPTPLEPFERDGLVSALIDLRCEPVPGERDSYLLTPGSTIGAVSIGDINIEIVPKLPIDRVVFMLSYALGTARWDQPVNLQGATSITEAMASVLAWHVSRATQRGLLHGYRAENAALQGVRGRIRFDDQLRTRFGFPLPIEVTYDDFTDDIVENRLIKAALHLVGQRRIRNVEVARSIRHVNQYFDSIRLVPFHQHDVPVVRFTRLNEHYRGAVEWARLILRRSSFETRHGGQAGRSVLFDMNKVFEEFVRTAVRDELGLTVQEFPPGSTCPGVWLDAERQIRLQPDLSWWRHGRCLFVGDLKYKLFDDKALNADLYQLLAYATGTGLSSGLLVYAGETAGMGIHCVTGTGKELSVMAIRMDGPIESVRGEVRRVASAIGGRGVAQGAA